MAKYRIKAYFMHEHEAQAAQDAVDASVISEPEWTRGYLMGVVDGSKIKSLTKKGLVISAVEKIESAGQEPPVPVAAWLATSPGIPVLPAGMKSEDVAALTKKVIKKKRPLPVTVEHLTATKKILSHNSNRKDFYVVRFHGPITEERRKQLRKLRINLIERVSRNKYTAQLMPSQIKELANLSFIDCIRLYTEADTLRIPNMDLMQLENLGTRDLKREPSTTPSSRRTRLYRVKLHQKKDLPAVTKWLKGRGRKPLWKHGDQFQIAMPENSKILADLVQRLEVAIVEQVEAPQLSDEPARTLLGLIRKKTNIGLTGEGEIIGIADTGIDQSHPDLKNRIAGVSAWGRKNDVSDPEGHGTHVAGCAVGDGTASKGEVMGAAPEAKVFFQSILDDHGGLGGLPNNIGDLLLEAYNKGARIHNDSWGAFNYARYATTSLDVDRFVADHPDMLVVIAAGNDGIGIPRLPGSKMSAVRGFVDWPCVAAPATAKNALTVGASRSSRTEGGYAKLTWNEAWPERYPDAPISKELISSNEQGLAAFSSRGPSNDLRIKPDVVAPGTDIAAAKSKDAPLHKFWGAYPNNDQYGFMGGTSMAAPYVAGCAALVRQWYRQEAKWATPSAALLKATLLNGTKRIGGVDAVAELIGDPNYHQGFGRIDVSQSIPNPFLPELKLVFADTWKDSQQIISETGDRVRYEVKVGKRLPLRICLAWTDPGARALQNSLVLLVDDSKGTKWVGNAQAATLLNISGGPRDPNNNVQIVRIEEPEPGNYTIAITGSMVLLPPQAFALVVTGDLKSELIPLP